ncbi:hypothetical protein [Emticicia sp. W12TSBA100-4]|uniref:hypothetical protein n=1 Tax=Emticicia sp. W12TSBA100-4 TaxID=3160965 RepID=UPI0033061A93
MKTTCGHNCHLLRTGCECSPCKYKPQTDTTMNYEIQRLKEIIEDKNEEIEELKWKNERLSIQLNQISDEPMKRINEAIPFIDAEILRCHSRNKQFFKDLKKILQNESTKRTVATKN